jgi:hypothetical protein
VQIPITTVLQKNADGPDPRPTVCQLRFDGRVIFILFLSDHDTRSGADSFIFACGILGGDSLG